MTSISPLSRALINASAPAVQLLTRQYLLLYLKLPFCGHRNCFAKHWEGLALIPGWSTCLQPALLKEKASTYLTQKAIEIPNNAT